MGTIMALKHLLQDGPNGHDNQDNLTESACFLQAETDGYNNGTQTPTPGWPQWT